MKRTKRSFRAFLTFQIEYKVGISNKPKRRETQVTDDLESGKALVILQVQFNSRRRAKKVEGKLHALFATSRFKQRTQGKGKAGSTEWFYLSATELMTLEAYLWHYKYPLFAPAVILVIICLFYSAWFGTVLLT